MKKTIRLRILFALISVIGLSVLIVADISDNVCVYRIAVIVTFLSFIALVVTNGYNTLNE